MPGPNKLLAVELFPIYKVRTFFHVHLIDGTARIFSTSRAATGNQTHVSSVAPHLRDLHPARFSD